MRSDWYSKICALLLICPKIHPEDDPTESKYVSVCLLYTFVIEGYLSTPHFTGFDVNFLTECHENL